VPSSLRLGQDQPDNGDENMTTYSPVVFNPEITPSTVFSGWHNMADGCGGFCREATPFGSLPQGFYVAIHASSDGTREVVGPFPSEQAVTDYFDWFGDEGPFDPRVERVFKIGMVDYTYTGPTTD
jgi:hypothetical protein